MDRSVTIDAHQHFWDPVRAAYPWMTEEYAPIRRPFTPDDLRPLLEDAGIDYSVLVQTRASLTETVEFLELAMETDFVAGVVGWVDLADAKLPATIRQLRAGPGGEYLVAIRHQVHDEPDASWLLRQDVMRGLEAVGDADLAYDLLVRTRELPAVLQVARRFPTMRFVIDHLAKPPISTGEVDTWAEAMAPFSDLGNVFCKVSGMVTEAKWQTWTVEDLMPYVQRVLDWFGEERLMVGSDWPVCLLAGSYKNVVQAYREALSTVDQTCQRKIMGDNARIFYRLPEELIAGPHGR